MTKAFSLRFFPPLLQLETSFFFFFFLDGGSEVYQQTNTSKPKEAFLMGGGSSSYRLHDWGKGDSLHNHHDAEVKIH